MRTFSLLLVLLLCDALAFGQYGTAPNGYYPSGYNGDIFSGKVTAVDETSEEITISFEQGKRTGTFVGRFQAPCAVSSKDGKPMRALDIPIGTDISAFFETNVRRDGNTSAKENSIIGIMFHSWDGRPVRQQSKKMYLCSATSISHYWRCFGSAGNTCVEPRSPVSTVAK